MKQGKKIISVVIALTILVLCLSGCGVTKEKLLIKIGESMLQTKSYTINAVVKVEMSGTVLGSEVTANINANIDTDINANPFVGHAKGTMTMEVMGQSQKMDIELYEEIREKELIVYARVNGSDWQKQNRELPNDNSKLIGIEGLTKIGDRLELEEETVTANNEECYKIKGKVDGETLQQIVDLTMSGSQVEEWLDSVDEKEYQVPAEIYVSKKDKQLVKMSFDMMGVMDAAMESVLGQFSGLLECEKCVFDISFSNFNEVEQIVIPKDVKDSSKEG